VVLAGGEQTGGRHLDMFRTGGLLDELSFKIYPTLNRVIEQIHIPP
jgi:hypothetical protein